MIKSFVQFSITGFPFGSPFYFLISAALNLLLQRGILFKGGAPEYNI